MGRVELGSRHPTIFAFLMWRKEQNGGRENGKWGVGPPLQVDLGVRKPGRQNGSRRWGEIWGSGTETVRDAVPRGHRLISLAVWPSRCCNVYVQQEEAARFRRWSAALDITRRWLAHSSASGVNPSALLLRLPRAERHKEQQLHRRLRP